MDIHIDQNLKRELLIMEYCDKGNMDEFIKKEEYKNLESFQKIELMIQICKGVKSLHKIGILHRDLKLQNILVTSTK